MVYHQQISFCRVYSILGLPTAVEPNSGGQYISGQCLLIKYVKLFSKWLYKLRRLTSDLVFLSLALSLCLLTKPTPNERPPPKNVNNEKNVLF